MTWYSQSVPDNEIEISANRPLALGKRSLSPHAIYASLTGSSVLVIIVLIVMLSRGQTTGNEGLLLSILLTIFSILGSWLITHAFYQGDRSQQIAEVKAEYEANLKTYAVKASEKIINLSDQMGKLIEFIDDNEDGQEDLSYPLLRERMRAASHIMSTLQSMSETSLSDWEGVIGEQLARRRMLAEERDYDINFILESMKQTFVEGQRENLDAEFKKIYRDLKGLVRTPTALPPAATRSYTVLPCPNCDADVKIRLNKKRKPTRGLYSCSACQSDVAAFGETSGVIRLEVRRPIDEMIRCVECHAEFPVALDNAIGGSTQADCPNCETHLTVSRSPVGVNAWETGTQRGERRALRPEFLEQVAMLLPPEPWPAGTHKDIAQKLGVSNTSVTTAIKALMAQGRVGQSPAGLEPSDEPADAEVDTRAEAEESTQDSET